MKTVILSSDDNWVEGTVGPYQFSAKVYGKPSPHGINKGRVSKLFLRDEEGGIFLNFDGGWDEEPNSQLQEYVDAVLEIIEREIK